MKAIVSIKKGLAMVLAAALAIGSLSVPADIVNAASVPTENKTLEVGATATLSVTPDSATPTDANRITWESNDSKIVTVTADDGAQAATATIKALKAGNAVITAKKGGEEYKKWNVTVTAATPTTTISISPASITLEAGGDALTLTAAVTPEGKKVIWTQAAGDKLIISPSDGLATTATVAAKEGATGTTTVTATVEGESVSTNCQVTIIAKGTLVPVDKVTVSPQTKAMVVGEKANLQAIVSPSDATNRTVTWTSNAPAVVAVDAASGEVEAKAAGTATITATAGGKSDSCTVTVTAGGTTTVPVTGVTVTPATLSLVVNGTSTLTAAVAPANATNKAVTWSTSAPAVATVDAATGVVKAIAVGTATITATTADGNKTATCTVTVTAAATNVPVTGLSMSKTLVVGKNATRALKATVAPATATNKNVTWVSSNKTIATVDARGNVKGIRKGTAVITATSSSNPNVKATCTVTVTEVVLSKTALTMEFGQSSTALRATLSNTRLDSLVAWKTSNATVVRVDARTGKLTALNKAGWANITITTKAGATAVCRVTVKAPTVKSVTLNVKKLTMGVKESYKLNATVNPANAVNKKVTWTSDKPKVVKVKNGKLTALKAGKAKITVTSQADKSKKATITVTVKKTPDKKAKVTLNKKKVNLKVKKTFQIKAKISSKYGCASFKYTVDKKGKKVVKVDKNGKVTAKKKGKATITVKPYNGKGKSATIQITVK